MSIIKVSEDQIPYKFATTLIFTNGICPICRRGIYRSDKMNIIVDIEEGKNHFLNHSKAEQKTYIKNTEVLGI